MFMFDQKKALSSIMSSRKKDGVEFGPAKMKNESSVDGDGEPDSRHLAAQDMIAAYGEGSPEKVKQAMINFIDLHMAARNAEDDAEASGSRESVADDDSGD